MALGLTKLVTLCAIVLAAAPLLANAMDVDCTFRDPSVAVESAGLVVVAEIIGETKDSRNEGRWIAKFAIQKRWKGPQLTKTVDISWYGTWTPFHPGIPYLVLATRESDGRWTVRSNRCYRQAMTLIKPRALDLLDYLGKPKWEYSPPDAS